jgi:glyoxylase-like metal-dependent hydrolase (beta-lactamase superfamily II)/rhodanese-related sulfurtransferase
MDWARKYLMNTAFGLKQFRLEGCLSYIVYDHGTKQAFVIDPSVQLMDDYREYLADKKLKPILAIDTHTHADHFSATHYFKAEHHTPIAMSSNSKSERVTKKLKDGDELKLGTTIFKVLETPGHTDDGICLYGGGVVFTGDTLLIGSSGRTDFGNSNPKAEWESIHNILGRLPDETLVFPGHDYSDLLFSTIGTEKKKNEHWTMPSQQVFVDFKNRERIEKPSEDIQKVFKFNLAKTPETPSMEKSACTACGKPAENVGSVGAISVDKYEPKLKEHAPGTMFVDVRETEEFQDGHMPGAKNIPLSEVGFHLKDILDSKRVYFSCLGGGRSGIAAKTLSYIGHKDTVNVTGGFRAWSQAGLPVQK